MDAADNREVAEPNGAGRHFDVPSLIVILLTLAMFAAALAVKGLGHDLLLEAGVFLVSVKLIMMTYKGSVANARLLEELTAVRAALSRLEQRIAGADDRSARP